LAEQLIIVCDVCDDPAAGTALIKVTRDGNGKPMNYVKDLCEAHLTEVLEGSRKPTRGRRAAAFA